MENSVTIRKVILQHIIRDNFKKIVEKSEIFPTLIRSAGKDWLLCRSGNFFRKVVILIKKNIEVVDKLLVVADIKNLLKHRGFTFYPLLSREGENSNFMVRQLIFNKS